MPLKMGSSERAPSKGRLTLGQFLKLVGACATGGEAKLSIQEGMVQLNGQVCTQRGRALQPGDLVAYRGRTYRVALGEQYGH